MDIAFATATDTGRVRASNEDALLARPPLFLVADGVGGATGGEVASGEVRRVLAEYQPGGPDPREQLVRLLKKANRSIFELAETRGLTGMGTTATAALVGGRSVYLAHVGDSRAYRHRGGELTRLTEDHSLVAELVRDGSISEEEAQFHPQRSIITRALGIEPEVEVDVRETGWQEGDIYLLCSDGLTSMVGDEEIAALLAREEENLEQAAAALVAAANERGGHDNITVVLFAPGTSAPRRAGARSRRAKQRARKGGSTFSDSLSSVRGRLLLAALALAVVVFGAWLLNHNVFYVGVQDGRVAIYQGVPVELGPLAFSSVYATSDVVFDELEPYEQERIMRHELRSLGSARRVVDGYRRDGEPGAPSAWPETGGGEA